MGIKRFILEEIIDPLAVKYLLGRKNSPPWNGEEPWSDETHKSFTYEGLFRSLRQYRTPLRQRDSSGSLRRGERIFEELHTEIRTAHPEDGIAVIDTVTKNWEYAPCIADAEKLAAEMKNPGAVYFRPCYHIPKA